MRLITCAWGAALALACTEFESGSDSVDVSPLGAGAQGGVWSCLTPNQEPAAPPVFSGTANRVIYSVQVIDLSTGQTYPDAVVRACGIADINCENPVTDRLTVDAEGWVDLPLFQNFIGFLEVESSSAVPYLFYLTDPLSGSLTEYPLAIISRASLAPLVELLGVSLQAGTGVFAARVFDCEGNTASGVALSSDSEGTPWYFADGLPTASTGVTSSDGLGGFVNMQPGLAMVDMTAPGGISIAGPQSVVIRPGWLSAVFVRPPGSGREQRD